MVIEPLIGPDLYNAVEALKERYFYWDTAIGMMHGEMRDRAAAIRHETWQCVNIALKAAGLPEWEAYPQNA